MLERKTRYRMAVILLMIYTASPCRLIEKYGSISVTAQGMLIGGLALGLLPRPGCFFLLHKNGLCRHRRSGPQPSP